jgi:FkbM family methyltransferase
VIKTSFNFRPRTVDEGIYTSIVDDNKYHLPRTLDAEDVCVDIGAHIGAFSYACLERGAGRVIAIEPDHVNATLMRQHLLTFKARKEIYQAAVGRSDDQAGFRLMYTRCPKAWNTGGGHCREDTGIPTIAIRLDDILEDAGKTRILKLDCEGAEYAILYTSKKLHTVESICMEYHRTNPDTIVSSLVVEDGHYNVQGLVDFLKEQGFFVTRGESNYRGHLFADRDEQRIKTIQTLVEGAAKAAEALEDEDEDVRNVRKRKALTRPPRKGKNRNVAIKPAKGVKTFGWSSPYGGCWAENFYRQCGGKDLYKGKLKTSDHLRKTQQRFKGQLPQLMIMGNFVVDRAAMRSYCLENGVDVIHGEDGFFPHYQTLHVDPMGFCWESSIPSMMFHECSDFHRKKAEASRKTYMAFKDKGLPKGVQKPFVLWPLQLLGDRVNKHGLKATSWVEIIKHFRTALPNEYDLVLKPHPRGGGMDGIEALVHKTPGLVLANARADLRSIMKQCSAVAGANSTVLTEARLMFHKPVFAYGRSWYTNHTELVYPIDKDFKLKVLPHMDVVEDNALIRTERLDAYTNYYLSQLLARQFAHKDVTKDPQRYVDWLHKRTYQSYLEHGLDIFEDY